MELQGSLMIKTRELLTEHVKSMPEISNATGINFYWLAKFYQGAIGNPGVNTIQTLYEYLSNKKLKV